MLELISQRISSALQADRLLCSFTSGSFTKLFSSGFPLRRVMTRAGRSMSESKNVLVLGVYNQEIINKMTQTKGRVSGTYEWFTCGDAVGCCSGAKNQITCRNVSEVVSEAYDVVSIIGSAKWDYIVDNGFSDMLDLAEQLTTSEAGTTLKKLYAAYKQQMDTNGTYILYSTLGLTEVVAPMIKELTQSDYSIDISPTLLDSHVMFYLSLSTITRPMSSRVQYYNGINETSSCILKSELLRIFQCIKSFRHSIFRHERTKILVPGQCELFDIVESTSGDVTASICVYDNFIDKNTKDVRKTVAMLVPPADQHHWLYRVPAGIKKIADKSMTKRCILVFMPDFNTEFTGKSQSEIVQVIQNNYREILVSLSFDKTKPVLLVTQQEEDHDERRLVARVESEYAQEIMVFDSVVAQDDDECLPRDMGDIREDVPMKPSKYMRRLMLFKSSPRCSQSELWYEGSVGNEEYVFKHISHNYHILVLCAFLSYKNCNSIEQLSGTILGLGGGVMISMLNTVLPGKFDFTAVDIDPKVLDMAKNHFGYVESDTNRAIIADGINFIQTSKEKKDFLIIDINGNHSSYYPNLEGVTGPAAPFLGPTFLDAACAYIKPEGIVLINAVCQEERSREVLAQHLAEHFEHVESLKYGHELNELFICSNADVTELDNATKPRALFKSLADKYPHVAELTTVNPMYLSKHSTQRLSLSVWI